MRAIVQSALHPGTGSASIAMRERMAPLSDGEVSSLYWFVQGGILTPDTWRRLWPAWGLCERHACGLIFTEPAFRQSGLALLFAALMQRAMRALQLQGPLWTWRLAWRLRDQEPCFFCDAGLGPHSHSSAATDILKRGRDLSAFHAFAARTRPFWQNTTCSRCLGAVAGTRCRPHLLADIRHGVAIDLPQQQELVADISRRASVYARAFRWDAHGSDTVALTSAVGWCSGWKALLQLVQGTNATAVSTAEAGRVFPDHEGNDQ